MTVAEIDMYIQDHAARFDLPVALIRAVIEAESAGDAWATRFEPHYRWCWDPFERQPFSVRRADAERAEPPAGFPSYEYSSAATEWVHQRTSWGLMQVMGAVAREYGLTQPLPTLCRPGRGIEYGCRHLARLSNRFLDEHGWEGVAAAYNAGTPRRAANGDWVNQAYVDKIAALGAADLFEGGHD